MKTILINQEQKEKIIKESLSFENSMQSLPSNLFNDLKNKNVPLSNTCCFPDLKIPFLEKLYGDAFNDSKMNFSDDITSYTIQEITNKLNKLLYICKKKESQIRGQLEKICSNIIIELFDIPEDTIDIECHLVDEISPTKQFHTKSDVNLNVEYNNSATLDNIDEYIDKRQILLSISYGASIKLAKQIKSLYLEKIFDIDEELPHLYSQIEKINNYLLFTAKYKITDKKHMQNGYVDVTLGNDFNKSKINVEATIFPILLSETLRGFMELFISYGLPDDKKISDDVINFTDVLEDEPYYMMIGEKIWGYLTSSINEMDSKDLPIFISTLSSLDNKDFFLLMKEIFSKNDNAKESIEEILKYSIYKREYSDFENDIIQKQDERGLIDDDASENNEDEEILDEATYPETFNMETFKSLRSFRQRILYCQEHLQRISSGSSRIVYKIDDNTVLKLAKNQKGIAQNESEGGDWYKMQIGCFAEVYDVDNNYLWLEMQLARKAKPSDFKRITGYDFNFMREYINYIKSGYSRKGMSVSSQYKQMFQEFMESDDFDYSLFQQIEEYLGNYQLESVRDLQRISSWGIVTDEDGEDRLVIIDFGLSDDVYNDYYRE